MIKLGVLILSLMLTHTAWAFGVVDSVIGNASALSVEGNARFLTKGSKLESKETVITAQDAEVLIKTDDKGLILLKPDSKLYIDGFHKGHGKDFLVVKLLQGSVYGEGGSIGASSSSKFQISTPNSEIILNKAHYHVAIAKRGTKLDTYVKVEKGQAKLISRTINVNIEQAQLGVATSSEPPHLLVLTPDGVFVASKITMAVKDLSAKNAKALAARSASIERAVDGRIPDDCAQDSPAQKVLDDFIAAYERGDIGYIQRRLDPSMVGYGAFLKSMMEDVNAQKQIRFLIQNRNVQCGPNLAVVNFKWEKRYLDLVTFRPRLETGQAAILTHLKAGEWKLSGISGKNPFAPRLNQATTLIVTPKAIRVNAIGTFPIATQVKLISPDMEGVGVVQAEVFGGGDRELLNLTEVQPGVFVINQLNAIDTPTAPNSGLLSIPLLADTIFTFRYKNNKSGLVASDVLTVTEF